MKTDSNKNIADYYNQTLNHYERWWKLDKTLAVHYGFWDADTRNFSDALENTNHYLLKFADMKDSPRVLDAGCGVGGSSFFLAKQIQAKVTGITLSDKQLKYANEKAIEQKMTQLVDFKLEDYTKASFNDGVFDLIWAIESITSAPDKNKFAKEAFRILKPGGKLIIADYFKTNKDDHGKLLDKWQTNWSMAPFLITNDYIDQFEKEGFSILKNQDVTEMIAKTSKRMYYSSLLGTLPSITYNILHNTSRYAKDHYKSGFYQYQALKKGLWKYRVLLFQK